MVDDKGEADDPTGGQVGVFGKGVNADGDEDAGKNFDSDLAQTLRNLLKACGFSVLEQDQGLILFFLQARVFLVRSFLS